MCAIQFFDMHASVSVTGKRRHTSLGAGATECSDGAHEDNQGHKSSNSNADDHCHWERFCREQQREMFFYSYITTKLSNVHSLQYQVHDREYKKKAHSHNAEANFPL